MKTPDDDPDEIEFKTMQEYIGQWKHNRKCLASIDRDFVDWQITVTFYTALHAVNAAAAHLGEKPRSHQARNELVKSNQVFAPIRVNYLRLYRVARFTRYDPMPESWLPESWIDAQYVIDNVLKPIENNIEMILPKPLNLTEIKLKR